MKSHWSDKRVTVTGGAGFLGQHVVKRLASYGAKVYVPRQRDYNLVSLDACLRCGPDDVLVLGQSAFAKMKLGLHLMRRAEYISDYDVVVGTHLAKVLSGGGEFTSPQRVSEQYLLDLEREAFVSLCGQRKTVERIQHMLKKGKPLRN